MPLAPSDPAQNPTSHEHEHVGSKIQQQQQQSKQASIRSILGSISGLPPWPGARLLAWRLRRRYSQSLSAVTAETMTQSGLGFTASRGITSTRHQRDVSPRPPRCAPLRSTRRWVAHSTLRTRRRTARTRTTPTPSSRPSRTSSARRRSLTSRRSPRRSCGVLVVAGSRNAGWGRDGV